MTPKTLLIVLALLVVNAAPTQAQAPQGAAPQAAPPQIATPQTTTPPAATPQGATPPAATPQANTPGTAIQWEVQNRFRLFRAAEDFQRQVTAQRAGGVLQAERLLEREADGRGWARTTVDRLCLDAAGHLVETCTRDGERESYLKPADYPVRITFAGTAPPGATCAWTLQNNTDAKQELTIGCEEEITTRVPAGVVTRVVVDAIPKDGPVQHAETDIRVRDLLIAGLGDSIAAGEGNPDKPIALSEEGFCFRRFLGTSNSQYYRPGRAGFRGDKSCEAAADTTPGAAATSTAATQDWQRHGARWMNAACHASLYGYQMRAALALAVENPQIAVTYVPLACSGATIAEGLLGSQTARECPLQGSCASSSPAQVRQLEGIVRRAGRSVDLMFLTIGANDIKFAGLVGNVIIEDTAERELSRRGDLVVSPQESNDILRKTLPASFVKLRTALKPLVGGNLRRVVYVSYGHPALQGPDNVCTSGRDGFDVHPALDAKPERLQPVAAFVSERFLPAVKALATCGEGILCNDKASESMSFVDAHQQAFAEHGFCVRADTDPAFDRKCFSQTGDSFEQDQTVAPDGPLACDMRASDYRPYASRARWVRTANDSYFTAMTYPQGLPALLKPRDIHDAMWGIVSALYGGAIHPTAEGHAVMADAALPMARAVLDLPTPPDVTAAPLAPLTPPTAPPAASTPQ